MSVIPRFKSQSLQLMYRIVSLVEKARSRALFTDIALIVKDSVLCALVNYDNSTC